MTPQRRRAFRRPIAATAALVVLGFATLPAAAQAAPPPSGGQDPMQRYQELGTQAAKADEDLLGAQEQLAARQSDRAKSDARVAEANSEVAGAQAEIDRLRPQANQVANAALEGGQLSNVAVLLDSRSRQEFLDRTSILSLLAEQKNETLTRLQGAVATAGQARAAAVNAQKSAQLAADDAATALEEVQGRKADLDNQIGEVRKALAQLPSSDRSKLGKVQDNGSYLGPPGAANDALQVALSKRGSEYQWGATGPSEFDCSGLTSWAYKQAGVSLPRASRQQFTAGKAVPLDQLVPGDLLFYDDGSGDAGAIHHVGMYVGGGKMVDAPTEGQLVDVRPIRGDGHLMGARRIVG
ncbi:C40 family peptidase [Amycolatopsis saalfeldensis]|uniref:Cell wall-associated hydrolase, NlpC family n=1 Tax=Amycolatopsis saalfeldensis TaxID=394193 RepID=A0A1H8YND6_9PSEU|nr:C40 family peptidase [Amycolatopsis saalfeldensis]SEP53552.1 Cell wall-associated hydrolase, NlpC family [Amycolatopsis saalfeldensis]